MKASSAPPTDEERQDLGHSHPLAVFRLIEDLLVHLLPKCRLFELKLEISKLVHKRANSPGLCFIPCMQWLIHMQNPYLWIALELAWIASQLECL
ncbi:hypothetical protein OPV22_028961 [Ensete ventricosum]|uniref:Uncharacterized protein n=1 Tax=Ensete ventricosum TaxID=4639 RepID=A0AAV8Q1S0_ENSVE|nr:hypothetical protein OPV22_028928 [Ensete ventricosum]KAJ8466409.1 hypothetical protein OPV22_028961 [Ensete ventricosum]